MHSSTHTEHYRK